MTAAARTLAWFAILHLVLSQVIIRYMPFGDSITDYGCWRPWVWEKLTAEGYFVDFVGSCQAEVTCKGLDYDRDHEGHPGFSALGIARDKLLVNWLRENPADVVTMHLGTVDIMESKTPPPDILNAFSILVSQMRDQNPRMKIVVAQIIPYPQNDALVRELNSLIPDWARSMNLTRSPIWVVDQWIGFDGEKDLYDGIHPSESGNVKISEKFYPAILQAVGSVIRDHYLLQ